MPEPYRTGGISENIVFSIIRGSAPPKVHLIYTKGKEISEYLFCQGMIYQLMGGNEKHYADLARLLSVESERFPEEYQTAFGEYWLTNRVESEEA